MDPRLLSLLAAALFTPLFLSRLLGWQADFWWWLSGNIALCTAAGAWRNKVFFEELRADFTVGVGRKLLIGAAAALFLYIVFFLGNIASRALFGWAGEGIDNVYTFKGGAAALRIGLLMALVIGPGEELLWRVQVQGGLARRGSQLGAFLLAAAVYTAVHLPSLNPMLILAAAVCGAFWGLLYLFFRSPLINIVSHTLWDIAVFLLFPFR